MAKDSADIGFWSPLAMAEWIEICDAVVISFFSSVSASDGGVD